MMTKYIFASIFAEEMSNYLKYLKSLEKYFKAIKSTLISFDKYLLTIDHKQKNLSEQTISEWLRSRDVHQNTKAGDISDIKGFVKYLTSLGFNASCPEAPKRINDYTAYLFSDLEIERIFKAADNFGNKVKPMRSDNIFPILLRILYGCGLRLGEGIILRWKNVNLNEAVITIVETKNHKQRFVPMNPTLNDILTKYKRMTLVEKICTDYLFESDRKCGNPYYSSTFDRWFQKILHEANINYSKANPKERGVCPHCLRHTFTHNSFLQSERNGERFENFAPFLAAFLGHASPKGTEEYLSSNHALYTQSHKRVNDAIGNLFPEVCFDEV
jgi:integrase